MLQMRNGQSTVVRSETAIFIKFHWIHWHENDAIKNKQKDVITTHIASQRTDVISETAVFIKFQWIHIEMKTNLLGHKAAKHDSKYK